MKGDNRNLARHAHTEWDNTTEAIGDIKATISNGIESAILLVFQEGRRQSEKRELSTVGMATQCQLHMTMRQDFTTPCRRIMFQKNNEILPFDTIKC